MQEADEFYCTICRLEKKYPEALTNKPNISKIQIQEFLEGLKLFYEAVKKISAQNYSLDEIKQKFKEIVTSSDLVRKSFSTITTINDFQYIESVLKHLVSMDRFVNEKEADGSYKRKYEKELANKFLCSFSATSDTEYEEKQIVVEKNSSLKQESNIKYIKKNISDDNSKDYDNLTDGCKFNCWSSVAVSYFLDQSDGTISKDAKKNAMLYCMMDKNKACLKLMSDADMLDFNKLYANVADIITKYFGNQSHEIRDCYFSKRMMQILDLIPLGYIMAFSQCSSDRNDHVFLCLGNGYALEFDANKDDHSRQAGANHVGAIWLHQYTDCHTVWYSMAPWNKGFIKPESLDLQERIDVLSNSQNLEADIIKIFDIKRKDVSVAKDVNYSIPLQSIVRTMFTMGDSFINSRIGTMITTGIENIVNSSMISPEDKMNKISVTNLKIITLNENLNDYYNYIDALHSNKKVIETFNELVVLNNIMEDRTGWIEKALIKINDNCSVEIIIKIVEDTLLEIKDNIKTLKQKMNELMEKQPVASENVNKSDPKAKTKWENLEQLREERVKKLMEKKLEKEEKKKRVNVIKEDKKTKLTKSKLTKPKLTKPESKNPKFTRKKAGDGTGEVFIVLPEKQDSSKKKESKQE